MLYHLNLINSSCEIHREGPGTSAFVNETYLRVVLPGPGEGGWIPAEEESCRAANKASPSCQGNGCISPVLLTGTESDAEELTELVVDFFHEREICRKNKLFLCSPPARSTMPGWAALTAPPPTKPTGAPSAPHSSGAAAGDARPGPPPVGAAGRGQGSGGGSPAPNGAAGCCRGPCPSARGAAGAAALGIHQLLGAFQQLLLTLFFFIIPFLVVFFFSFFTPPCCRADIC